MWLDWKILEPFCETYYSSCSRLGILSKHRPNSARKHFDLVIHCYLSDLIQHFYWIKVSRRCLSPSGSVVPSCIIFALFELQFHQPLESVTIQAKELRICGSLVGPVGILCLQFFSEVLQYKHDVVPTCTNLLRCLAPPIEASWAKDAKVMQGLQHKLRQVPLQKQHDLCG